MEIINKSKVLFIGLLFTLSVNAQNYNQIVESFKQSYKYEASDNIAEASIVLQKVYDENSYEMNLRLGWLSYSSGLLTESLNYYTKAVQLKPFAVEPRFGIVLPQLAMGNLSSVILNYEKILEITPNNSIALYRLGLIYYEQKNYIKAEIYFEKVVNLYPFDYDALVMHAWTNFQLKKFRQAEVLFYKALVNNPQGESALEGLKLLKK